MTEVRFEEALEEAKNLDHESLNKKKSVGSSSWEFYVVKDNIRVQGLATSTGFAALVKARRLRFPIITLLQDLGAIVICKTNTSAGMMYSETNNLIWRRALNPFNRVNPNNEGSSGGVGAIDLLRGSCFEILCDISGSVRCPAVLNNVFCIKPSYDVLPSNGTTSGQSVQETVVQLMVFSYSLGFFQVQGI